jgi:hypothetical protein
MQHKYAALPTHTKICPGRYTHVRTARRSHWQLHGVQPDTLRQGVPCKRHPGYWVTMHAEGVAQESLCSTGRMGVRWHHTESCASLAISQNTTKQVPAGEQLAPLPKGAPGRCSTTLLGRGMHGLQSGCQSAPQDPMPTCCCRPVPGSFLERLMRRT